MKRSVPSLQCSGLKCAVNCISASYVIRHECYFCLYHEDAQDRDHWRLKIKDNQWPRFTWQMAVWVREAWTSLFLPVTAFTIICLLFEHFCHNHHFALYSGQWVEQEKIKTWSSMFSVILAKFTLDCVTLSPGYRCEVTVINKYWV